MADKRGHRGLWFVFGVPAIVLFLTGCGAGFDPQGGPPEDPDRPAAIVAGEQTVEPGAWVRLDGSQSYDPRGSSLSYFWSQVSGPMVDLESWRTPIASFDAPATEPGEPLVFKLEVDNGAASADATTQVRVIRGAPPDHGGEVHADAGPDQGVLSGEQVTLDGSASSGPGEGALEFEWTQTDGVPVELQDADEAVARFEAPAVEDLEALTFQLTVAQGDDLAVDEVIIVVIASGGSDGGDGEDPQCSDGVDNDGDGLVDYPVDPGCSDRQDDDEFDEEASPACSDGMDNDDDGLVDYPADPGCDSTDDDDEYNDPLGPACSDGVDNDGDGLTDFPDDPDCYGTVDDDESDSGRQTLLLTNLNGPDAVKDRWDEWGVQKAIIIGGWCFELDDDWHWSEEERSTRTDYCIESQMPDPNFDGFVCLDWEGDPLGVLRDGADHPLHAETMAEYLRLLEYVKSQRPLAKVGYYTLPFREYWSQDEGWLQAIDDARPIFEASGALFPSVYDFYGCSDDPEDGNYQCARDHERFGNIIRLSLEMAEGKPVFPYTCHRHHNSTEQWGAKMIPEDEYIAHIHHLLHNVEYNGDTVDGIVAWGADEYYYNYVFETEGDGSYTHRGSGADRLRQFFWDNMLPDETIEDFLIRLYPRLYSNMRQALEGE